MIQGALTDRELVEGHRRGDGAAREQLILRHAGLVRRIARRYAGRGLALDDLVQTGYVGLLQAVDRYDPSHGAPLEVYAARTIEGEIMHLFRDRGWAVHMPRSLQDLSRRIAKESERMAHTLGRRPSAEELAEELQEPVELITDAQAARRAYRADRLVDPETLEDGGEIRRLTRALSVEEPGFAHVEDSQLVVWALRRLPVRERRVILLRYYDGLTQTEIAEHIGVSQMHVSRIVRSSLRAMRTALEAGAA